jgi:hypothetical protein
MKYAIKITEELQQELIRKIVNEKQNFSKMDDLALKQLFFKFDEIIAEFKKAAEN